MAEPRPEALHGLWVHSHEEDEGDDLVLRPASHPLPPARGRLALDLRTDGTYTESRPGPVDLPVESGGDWSLEDGRLVLGAAGDRAERAWEVVSADPDRLVVRREV